MSKLDNIKARLAKLPSGILADYLVEALTDDEYDPKILDVLAHAPDDLAYLIGEVERLRGRLRNLVNILTDIEADESYKTVWTIAHMHGMVYSGPNWKAEQRAAEEALEAHDA